jgi:hypothetical protein
MQSHYLEYARLTRKRKLSYYMKKYHDDVTMQLNFDPKDKSYQVTVIIGNLNILRRNKFIILIYKSIEKIWDIRNAYHQRTDVWSKPFPKHFHAEPENLLVL